MSSLIITIILFSFHYEGIGLEVGKGYFKNIGSPLLFGIYYILPISRHFEIEVTGEYWQMSYSKTMGARSLRCTFCDMYFTDTGVYKTNLFNNNITFKVGAGIGVHLLKNSVVDKLTRPGIIVTDYYTLTDNTLGLHAQTGLDVRILPRVLLFARIRWLFILTEGDVFYTRGNIRAQHILLGSIWSF